MELSARRGKGVSVLADKTMRYLTVKRKGYVTVKLRKELAHGIDAFLEQDKKGYASRTSQ
jgi:hypothetical protein